MKQTERPEVSAKVAYLTCSAAAVEPTRTVLAGLTDRAVLAASEYSRAADEGEISGLDPSDFSVAPQTDPHLRDNYNTRMVKHKSGREIYDQIRLSSSICLLCDERDSSTLDHYLPKSHFPLLAVAPDNLFPACFECNQSKAEYYPGPTKPALLHPYFDDFIEDRWLVATVVEQSRCVAFEVAAPSIWSSRQVDRLNLHFDRLSLRRLYSMRAASEMANIREHMASFVDEKGRVSNLVSIASSTESARGVNHWKPVTYRALAASEWYVSGGYDFMA